MSGSNLKFTQKQENLIEGDHPKLRYRDRPLQHPLDSIYRMGSNESLRDIIDSLEKSGREVIYEFVDDIQEGQTVVKLTKFTYNPAMDRLFISMCGIDLYEGVDNQFVQSGPDEVTFNFSLRAKYDLLIVLGGTLNSETFGDEVDSGVRQFRQLADVPHGYFGHEGKVPIVNDQANGLIFGIPEIPVRLVEFNNEGEHIQVDHNERFKGWFPLTDKGVIKCIRVTPDDVAVNTPYVGPFELSIWTKQSGGHYVYYSGDEIVSILYDIMDIPFLDESGMNSVYIDLVNKGPSTSFDMQIYVMK